MAKKDFTAINTGRLYDTLQEATAEPAPAAAATPTPAEIRAAQFAADRDAVLADQKTKKARKTYSEDEAMEIMLSMQTTGHKGLKLPRINLAFAPDVYAYIKTMSQVRGENLTEFVNYILRKSMRENADIYAKAIEFKNSL